MTNLELIVRLLNVVAYVAMTVFGILLAGVTFTRLTRTQYPHLRWLDGKRLLFFLAFMSAVILYTGLSFTQEILSSRRRFQTVDLPEFTGEKATQSEFAKELSRRLSTNAKEANDYFRAAEQDFTARHYADAASLYRKSLDAVPTMSAYLNGGIAFTLSGNRATALSYFKSGLEAAQRETDSAFESNFVSNLAIETADTGELNLAESYARTALNISREAKLKSHEARALVVLATILEQESKTDEGISDVKVSLIIYQALKDDDGEATALATLGLLQADKDMVNEGVENLRRALVIHQKTGDVNGQIRVLSNLGLVLSNHGNLDAALESEQEALKMATPEVAALDRANLLNNIGTLYWREHKFALSEQCETESLNAYRDLGSKWGMASALNNLGLVHADSGFLDDAVKDFSGAAETFQALSVIPQQSEAIGNVAEVLRRQGKYRQARAEAQRALQLAQSITYHTGIADASGTLGLTYAALGQKEEAIAALRTACDLAQRYGLAIDQLGDYQRELQRLTHGRERKNPGKMMH